MANTGVVVELHSGSVAPFEGERYAKAFEELKGTLSGLELIYAVCETDDLGSTARGIRGMRAYRAGKEIGYVHCR